MSKLDIELLAVPFHEDTKGGLRIGKSLHGHRVVKRHSVISSEEDEPKRFDAYLLEYQRIAT